MSDPVRAWIGLGSNLGDPVATLRSALQALSRLAQTHLVGHSRLYRSPAWGLAAQPDFVNGVALLETSQPARALLDAMLGVEQEFGRVRRERWGPRVLDLDLLLYGRSIIDEPGLHVPHPHLHERAFALVPMLELDPEVVIPGRGPARDALALLASGPIEAVG
ncbi:MAG: 2-amino-4-hydroxy-6-hydroxymethyldihydropteridine diphosphokinase [Luteimonas sp.]